MHSMLEECSKQQIPSIMIYMVIEKGKHMLRVRANRSEAEIKIMWGALHAIDDAAVDSAAKALLALEGVTDWDNYPEDGKKQVRFLARTAIEAAYKAHAPKAPPVSPKPTIIM